MAAEASQVAAVRVDVKGNSWEARARIELAIAALQAAALPLGHRATAKIYTQNLYPKLYPNCPRIPYLRRLSPS